MGGNIAQPGCRLTRITNVLTFTVSISACLCGNTNC